MKSVPPLLFLLVTTFFVDCAGAGSPPPQPPAFASTTCGPSGDGGISPVVLCTNTGTSSSPTPSANASPPLPPPASPGAIPSPNVASSTGTYLVIANNTGFPNSDLYVYAVGGGQYLQADGTLAPIGGSAIPSLPLAASGSTILPFPYMNSARMYFSVHAPLKISTSSSPGFGADTPLYDWVEFNYGDGTLYINTTQVDMFGLPSTITVQDTGKTQTVGLPDGSRTALLSAFQADPVLKNLIVSDSSGALRVMAPSHGIDSGLIPASYIDAYVDQVWTYYQTHTLMLKNGWSGQVVAGSFVFTQGGQTVNVARPKGAQVFGCGLNADPLSPILCAGLNRGTLLDGNPQPDYNAANFYLASPTNLYAKIIHAASIDGKAYAFPYDDAGDASSTVVSSHPSTVTVTLSRF